MAKKISTSTGKAISARKLDAMHDAGVDISAHMDAHLTMHEVMRSKVAEMAAKLL